MPGESVLGGAGTRLQARLILQANNSLSGLADVDLAGPQGRVPPGEARHHRNAAGFHTGQLQGVTLAFGVSGPERVTTFAPTRTATAVAGTARPFTIVSVVAEWGVSRRP